MTEVVRALVVYPDLDRPVFEVADSSLTLLDGIADGVQHPVSFRIGGLGID